MRHGELGSIRNMFRAQHVTVKSAHGIDVPDPQNQVVDLANLNLCHFASSWVGKRSLMIALSARHSIPVGVNRDCPGLSPFIQVISAARRTLQIIEERIRKSRASSRSAAMRRSSSKIALRFAGSASSSIFLLLIDWVCTKSRL